MGSLLLGLVIGVAAPIGEESPFGLERRVPWTTSRVQGSPDPPSPYRTERAFPQLKFNEPLDMAAAPSGNRLFVVERYGKIWSFPNDPGAKQAELFLDLGKVAYGFVCHPKFSENGFCYVTYVLDASKEEPLGTRVSRFRVYPDRPWQCDPKSEQVVIEWPSGGHNGGCLMFGPDGYLYIATGDASGIADEYLTGQDLSVLPGKILRIDVDRPASGKAYRVPADNPFVSTEGARPEIWAYGLRQPWKMSFDRRTGDLWTGNVGQDLWEQIYRVERGGNYGWSVMEGSRPFRPQRPRGPTRILMPVIEHSHADFRSITGGFVYRGSRLKDLTGSYVYGDYDTGRIWAFRYDGGRVSDHRELVDSSLRLVGFAEDESGELFLVDHMGGGLHRLVPNPAAAAGSAPFPRRLSETGLFASTREHRPAAGLIPYSINAPAWSDGAHKEWYLALPGESQIEFEAIEFPQPAPGAHRGWKFPHGAVLVETISLDLAGEPARRRVETRILHHERLTGTEEVGDQYWRGYTYVWNDEQSDAELCDDPNGMDRVFTVRDARAPGGTRQQTWHVPSRAECTVCHNMAAKYALGTTTLQLNRTHEYGKVRDNQLRALEHVGVFTKKLPALETLPRLADPRDESAPLDARARAYLHANCSYCHRKWGGGNTEFQLLASLDLRGMGAVGTRPGHGSFAIPNAEVIAAGDPYRSVLYYRMAKLGSGRMPRAGSELVDDAGLRLVHDWIEKLPGPQAASDDAIVADLKRLRDTPGDTKTRGAVIERLTTRGALRLIAALDAKWIAEPAAREVVAQASQHKDTNVRELFERYLPESERPKRLGTAVRPQAILALTGNAARGKQLFFESTGLACRTCHRIGNQGGEVGPELSEIGKKLDREKLIESILEPSRDIDPKYITHAVATKSGRVLTGVLVEQTDSDIVLRDAQNQVVRLAKSDIEQQAVQAQSIMPELLLRDMTAQEVADLIEYLATLR